MTLRIGELFAGYGGLGLGVRSVLGGEVAWYSEIERGPLKVLSHRFPGVPNLGDVTQVDWSAVEPVDVLTGGSPCQDLSAAGKRAGMTEGTRSNLWVAMREAIAQLRPGLVIWENVRGAYSAAADSAVEPCAGCMGDGGGQPALRALGRVVGDLSDLGYVGGWIGLRAADVGAPHNRFRVFLAAHPAGAGRTPLAEQRGEPRRAGPTGPADARRSGLLPTPTGDDAGNITRESGTFEYLTRTVLLLPTPSADTPDSRRSRPDGQTYSADGYTRDQLGDVVAQDRWGEYGPAIERWEDCTRPAPDPVEPHPKSGGRQLSARFSEWMMGLPDGWVTDAPGITRNEALRALGNGVVPQQAAEAIRTLAGVL